MWQAESSRFKYQASGINTPGYALATYHIAGIFRPLPGSEQGIDFGRCVSWAGIDFGAVYNEWAENEPLFGGGSLFWQHFPVPGPEI